MKLSELVDLQSSACFITVKRDGLAAALGHDLRLEVTRYALSADGDEALSAEFDAASLRVVGSIGADGQVNPGEPSARDRATIEANIRDKVLEAKRHPTARFRTSRVAETASGYVVEGELALHGARKPIRLDVAERGGRLVARTTLHQPTWNITPFRALLGALRVQAGVEVELSVARR